MKRRVEVTVGEPESFAEKDPVTPGSPHPSECYYMNFVEAGGNDGFTAQCPCLCALKSGTAAWLNGGTFEEVQEAMSNAAADETHTHDSDNEDGSDAGEEWKKGDQ